MRIRSAVEIEDAAAGAEPSNRESRIKAGYRRLLRAVIDGKGSVAAARKSAANPPSHRQRRSDETPLRPGRRAAAAEYLSGFLCAAMALALLGTGCAGPRPLKGGKAATTRSQAGLIEQTVAQGAVK